MMLVAGIVLVSLGVFLAGVWSLLRTAKLSAAPEYDCGRPGCDAAFCTFEALMAHGRAAHAGPGGVR